jgi:cell division protein FtsB
MVVKRVIEEEDGRQRIAELKAQRLQVEAEIATLEEAPQINPRPLCRNGRRLGREPC